MKILLHICCGPCASAVIEELQSQGHEVYGYFYNPNIHPLYEYRKRLEAVEKITGIMGVKLIGEPTYGMKEFLRNVVFREEQRCRICYNMRLEETAKMAQKGRFDAFTTTLLISPFQNHDLLREEGESHAVPFYYQDFRSLFKRSRELAEEHGLYRQQYCGCIYSEEERYRHQKKLK